MQRLSAAAESLAADYVAKLQKVEYNLGNERVKLTTGEAKSFVEDCKSDIEKHLDELFQKLNATGALAENGQRQESVKLPAGLIAVTPAMLVQINPSLPQSRAEELAPYLNKAIAESKIKTLVGQAMFLAQVLHEIGTRQGLHEGGGKENYQGKTYDYFFYMYDKDSADPARRYIAVEWLGNTQAGDGAKFHGRGYVQLTGRVNYQSAGDYLKMDLVNNPDLAAQPNVAVSVVAWFWQFGHKGKNKNAADYADVDSIGNFQKVTQAINGGTKGWNERVKLYNQAKKALGI